MESSPSGMRIRNPRIREAGCTKVWREHVGNRKQRRPQEAMAVTRNKVQT